ncbi:MAG: GNAT family N-acetyltransferase [Bacillota bacterium]
MIYTNRLVLRKFKENDIDLIYDINNDPECIKFNGWDSMSYDECKTVLKKWMDSYDDKCSIGVFCIECNKSKEKIGMAFIKVYAEPGQYEIGFRLRRLHWDKGYAKEITKGFISHAEAKLNAKEIVAEVYKANTRSRSIFEKLGFDMYQHPDGEDGLLYRLVLNKE